MTRRVDAVVIGSGPGGAVTARVLAEAGLDVIVVEEGDWVEAGSVEPYSVDQMQRQYRNAGLTVALGRPSIAYTEGCGAGGGSEVNSGLYHRPSAQLLDAWSSSYRIEGLDTTTLEPYHRRVERALSVAPWPEPELPAPSRVLQRGANALGWSGFDVPRWARYHRENGGIRVEKQTMSRTYLPAATSAGAQLWTNAKVSRLTMSGPRVDAIEVVRRDGRVAHHERVVADHVFVCAGATQTPALLQRSGLRRNIGGNLSVHPTVKVVAEFADEVNAPGDLATYQVKEFGSWLSFGGSASRPALIALALSENWPEFHRATESWRRQTVYYAAIQSQGRGRVTAVPGFTDPLVTYRLTPGDGARLRSGLARLIHLMLAAGATTVYPSYAKAPVVTNRVDAAAAVEAFAPGTASLMTVHLTGSVPMGEDITRSGADSFGAVHGTTNLRVNDASLLPWAPGVNPQGTLMAVAHRNIDHFLADLGRPTMCETTSEGAIA
ncbi:MAG: GMC family oxidoreductase N-terminal domain-containing protein [Nocardioidaceae bacterium]